MSAMTMAGRLSPLGVGLLEATYFGPRSETLPVGTFFPSTVSNTWKVPRFKSATRPSKAGMF